MSDANSTSPVAATRTLSRACAECRRAKSLCSRTVPCTHCVDKDCADLCPDGTNITGQGHRRFWQGATARKEQLTLLAERIADLEEALQASDTSHALLAREFLGIKEPFLQRRARPPSLPTPTTPEATRNDDQELTQALGSLVITDMGRTRYIGPSVTPWLFLLNEHGNNGSLGASSSHSADLPIEFTSVSTNFPLDLVNPLIPCTSWERLASLRRCLPSIEEAQYLKTLCFKFTTWYSDPMSENDFDQTVLPVVYNSAATFSNDQGVLAQHQLSLMFVVFALGSLVRPNLPPLNSEAARYYQLAHAALCGSRAVEEPTYEALSAALLMTTYVDFSYNGQSIHHTDSAIMAIAVRMAFTMGIHRDSEAFNIMTPQDVEKRRRLYVVLYCRDKWMALKWGLPPMMTSTYSDVKTPSLGSSFDDAFLIWNYSFGSKCIEPLITRILSVQNVTYSTVLDMDTTIRELHVPDALLVFPPVTNIESMSYGDDMRRMIASVWKDVWLVILHRNFFDRATTEYANDPLASPFGTSAIASYRSAWSAITVFAWAFDRYPCTMARVWNHATALLLVANTLATLVIRCPALTFAEAALIQIDEAQRILRTMNTSYRLEEAESTMLRLRDDAHTAHAAYRSGKRYEGDSALLSRISGNTRFIDHTRGQGTQPQSSSSTGQAATNLHSIVAPLGLNNQADLHPSVIDYLNGLNWN